MPVVFYFPHRSAKPGCKAGCANSACFPFRPDPFQMRLNAADTLALHRVLSTRDAHLQWEKGRAQENKRSIAGLIHLKLDFLITRAADID
jgi:hypothetical protein